MYLFTRRTRLADGNGTAGVEWAGSIAAKVTELTGQEIRRPDSARGQRAVVDEECAFGRALDIDELELLKVVGGVGREQPLSVSRHRRRDHESQLVDEPG